jgi:hypothetical protein
MVKDFTLPNSVVRRDIRGKTWHCKAIIVDRGTGMLIHSPAGGAPVQFSRNSQNLQTSAVSLRHKIIMASTPPAQALMFPCQCRTPLEGEQENETV